MVLTVPAWISGENAFSVSSNAPTSHRSGQSTLDVAGLELPEGISAAAQDSNSAPFVSRRHPTWLMITASSRCSRRVSHLPKSFLIIRRSYQLSSQ
jgi:hypothetical protein